MMSYGGSKRGGWCEIACAHFFSYMANLRNLKLCTTLLSFVNVHIFRTGGSSYFSLSYGGSTGVEGLK
jgi:hypothetical protein